MSSADGLLTRREWLARMNAAAVCLVSHEALGREPASAPRPIAHPDPPHASAAPRIRRVRLLTAVPLAKMREFYHDRIGFPVVEETNAAITFAAGATKLTFAGARPDQIKGNGGRGNGEPMYHFAFNIPRNRILAARKWQLERTPLIDPRPGLREPGVPDEIWHFRHWNARSIFFFDPAWNIVEYIARHELPDAPGPDRGDPRDSRDAGVNKSGNGASDTPAAAAFSTADILYASEIGFVVDRPRLPAATRMLRETLGLHEYPRGADPWAMGDARGLLLCLARIGEQWGEHTPTPVNWGVFQTECTVAGTKAGQYSFDGFPYKVRVE